MNRSYSPRSQGDQEDPSFDGLSGLVEECCRQDLLDGHLFLFVNRRRDRIKALYFDHDGLAIWYKRLEVGCFQVPDAGDRDGIELDPAQLAMILSGIDLRAARRRQRFRPAGRIPPKNEGNSSERDLHNSNIRV
jgi:transposase